MNNPALDSFDWSLTTWEGSRREQLRVWASLDFRSKMEALEEMADFAFEMLESRRRRGQPYIDPYTGQLVRPTPATNPEMS